MPGTDKGKVLIVEGQDLHVLSFNGIFGEKPMQGGSADAKLCSCLADISPMFGKGPLNKFFFN